MTLNISKTEHSRDPQPHPEVADVQAALIHRGYSCGKWGADGQFGDYTDAAVRAYQRKMALLVDGVVGPHTAASLGLTAHPAPHPKSTAVRCAEIALARVLGRDGASRPRYLWDGKAHPISAAHPMALDCSGLVEWTVYHATGHEWRDGSSFQASACHIISASQAMRIEGALLFESTNGRTSGVHHVAWSCGNGMTAEARSTDLGCGTWAAAGRFQFGGLVPVLTY